ncbi:MAG: glycosyltransferase [Pyrinomonadaceae bacterium]
MGSKAVKVIDVEIAKPLMAIEHLAEYKSVQALIRLHNVPLGYLRMDLARGHLTLSALRRNIYDKFQTLILQHLLSDNLAAPRPEDNSIADLLEAPHADFRGGSLPLITVAVCTRDRTGNLTLCLDSLSRLTYPSLDLLVVDNAPGSDSTEQLVRAKFPNVRYVCEPRPGLNWARNRAVHEARGEIVAYTDDDVTVDEWWADALAAVFAENADVMAVTGLVVPFELETEAQNLFERYGGFGRGFQRKWYRVDGRSQERVATLHAGAGKFGTGANMAYRRALFDRIGLFDPALDVGTVTNGGGDLDMFFRVLKEGFTLVYEPNAIVRHRHRRSYAELRTQIKNNGIGFYSYLVRSATVYPEERFALLRFGLWWLWRWNIRRLLISFARPRRFPRDLIIAELLGSFVGLGRYPKARRSAARIGRSFDSLAPIESVKERVTF